MAVPTNNNSSNEPLKGWKGNKYEGGHRVPFLVSWPNQIKGGQTFDGLTSAFDIFQTSINAAQAEEVPQSDGVNLLPFLNGEKIGNPHDILFWRKDQMAGVRYNEFKLIRLDDYGYRMYNLDNNLEETVDLISANPEKFNLLKEKLEQWEEEISKPLWLESQDWSQVTYEIHKALMENREPYYTNPGEMKDYINKYQ